MEKPKVVVSVQGPHRGRALLLDRVREEIRRQHEEYLKNDGGYVRLPSALAGK